MFDMFDMFKDQGQSASPSTSSASTDTFVVSVGGSTFFGKKANTALIAKLSESISALQREGYKFVLVAGGGALARDYVAAAKNLGANHFEQDMLGIRITRLNAQLLAKVIENAHDKVLTRVEDARKILDAGKVPVYGGLIPLFTTDSVGALIAEYLNATFVNLTNVDGIYSTDPRKYSKATFFPEISYAKLISLMKLSGSKPGQNLVLDLPCCLILQRSNLKALVVSGEDLSNFEAAIRGNEFKGTVVLPEEKEADVDLPETES